jgi:uncharacterized protein DUF222/HNH endonuclease
MGMLRSALDEFGSEDVAASADDSLVEDLEELERATRAIEVERARRVREIERRGVHRRDGDVSLTAWLARHVGIPASVAMRQVRLGRALGGMPATTAALLDGQISTAAAELLVSARDADRAEFQRSETMLVDLARRLPVRDLHRAVERWRALADAVAAEHEAARRFDRRGLYVSCLLDGMVRVDGELDAETGQTVITALRSIVDPRTKTGPDDARTPAQRRADALGEICRRYLDSGDRAAVAGDRPHLTVVADIESLEGRAGRSCELDEAGRITPRAARRIACDASISRVIVGADSEPLDVGRRTPVVPSALRRALVVRDRGCRFSGCDRPHGWCDAHHVVHWADGGSTSLANLVLLCRRHHRAVHDGEVRIAPGSGRLADASRTAVAARGP